MNIEKGKIYKMKENKTENQASFGNKKVMSQNNVEQRALFTEKKLFAESGNEKKFGSVNKFKENSNDINVKELNDNIANCTNKSREIMNGNDKSNEIGDCSSISSLSSVNSVKALEDNAENQSVNHLKGFKKYLVYVVTGLSIGFLNGFFGGGGGMVAVPMLQNFLKFDVKKSHATAIFIILPLCITSIITYYLAGSFDFTSGWLVSLGVVGGGVLGAILLKKLNSKIVEYIFAVLMIVAGVKLCLS